ncbi:MAG: YqgE/AlgH family protein [Planctomycetes bacterium]|nr:YqgE/AlgH family protein [Planctomycetota bacterium]
MKPTVTSGSFLLAAPSLSDPNFRRSVVLICEHSDQGSMGLVVNRPLDASLAQLFAEIVDDGGVLPEKAGQVFCGGPVEQNRLMALRAVDGDATGADHRVIDGVVLVDDIRAAVDAIARGEDEATSYRFLLGYAGWGAGQLDGELQEDSWIVRPATRELVFDVRSDAMWPNALRELGGVYRLYAEMPSDPTVN